MTTTMAMTLLGLLVAALSAGPGLQRLPNLPDGAPSFAVLGAQGQRVARINCIQNGYVDADELAARLMASPAVMARILATQGRLTIEDLGPAAFNCVVQLETP